jgi:hypothetical protein
VGAEEKFQALEDVLSSETFARSERLKSLLRFLCEAEIEGREKDLTEYAIGTLALGRPQDFAPLEDSSVRSRAFELRQKLEKYYSHEAPAASIRIELRKGSYVPRFLAAAHQLIELPVNVLEESIEAKPQEHDLAEPQSLPEQRRGPGVRFAVAAFVCGAVCMFGLIALWSVWARPGTRLPATRLESADAPSLWTPDLEAIWRPFLDTHSRLEIAYETRFFLRMGHLMVRDPKVNSLASVEQSEPLQKLQNLFGIRQLYASGNYTDIGAPAAMFYLSRLLGSRVPQLSARSSDEMTASDLRDSNIVLVGKPWLDPRIERVLASADLVDANGRIRNVHPAPGEPSEYKDQQEGPEYDSWASKYSVITLMPSPGGGKRILALTASGSEHPGALAYYMTNPDTVKDLVRHIRSASGTIPDYYQVLVRAEFKSMSLIKVDYVTYRPLKVK